jgi:hypothetical protein
MKDNLPIIANLGRVAMRLSVDAPFSPCLFTSCCKTVLHFILISFSSKTSLVIVKQATLRPLAMKKIACLRKNFPRDPTKKTFPAKYIKPWKCNTIATRQVRSPHGRFRYFLGARQADPGMSRKSFNDRHSCRN